MLKAGEVAPDLTGESASGEVVRLSDQQGHVAVVYFYPMDSTPGCTTEACAFRDNFERYEKAGIKIFGVSGDDAESHHEFRSEYKLPFILVADDDGDIMDAYGVPSIFGLASRVTFLVAPNGRIAYVWKDVDPGVHATEVLTKAKTITAQEASIH